jgi:hypothetical protein
MSNDIYPNELRGLGFSVRRTPEFSTIMQTSANFVETRISQTEKPRWHWELKYNYLKHDPADLITDFDYTDLETLMSFFLAHYGAGESFLFLDEQTPDYYFGPALIGASPNPDAALIVVYDPVAGKYCSPLRRTLGGVFTEDLADIDASSLKVYLNGTLKTLTTHYTVKGPGLAVSGASYSGMYIEWVGSGPFTNPTAELNYYWRVRFDEDMLDFEKFAQNLWAAGGQLGGSPIKFSSYKAYGI